MDDMDIYDYDNLNYENNFDDNSEDNNNMIDYDYHFSREGVNCQNGLVIPFWDMREHTPAMKVVFELLLLAFLIYLFICIAYLSETMITRFEKLTSTWNKTVASFTLLSFGVAAPQMLLSFYEMFYYSFNAVELGVSTILGSAAYKVLITIGYCMFIAPNTKINNVWMFLVSSIISMFSLICLFTIVTFISHGEVEVWEAVLMILLYPFGFVFLYLADCGKRFHLQKISPTEEIDLNADNLGEQSAIQISFTKSEKVWKIIRLISMPWSFIFDIIPSPLSCKKSCCNILLMAFTFIVAYFILMPIHVIILKDVVSHLGCSRSITDMVGGILGVTLGFCIPSTISARNAIKNGATVDDIIAKMIGSNIISVSLGIGFPWLVAAAYHATKGTEGGFQVMSGSLGFNTIQLTGYLVIATLMLLIGGIVNCGGKLQSNKIWRTICFVCFILFWVAFVVTACLESYM